MRVSTCSSVAAFVPCVPADQLQKALQPLCPLLAEDNSVPVRKAATSMFVEVAVRDKTHELSNLMADLVVRMAGDEESMVRLRVT